MNIENRTMKHYFFSLILIISITLGGLTGYFFSDSAQHLKPFGDIFIKVILLTIVPLIFFSSASAIARASLLGKAGKIMFYMAIVFIFTEIIASVLAILLVKIFPPVKDFYWQIDSEQQIASVSFLNQIVNMFSISNFSTLFSYKNILAVILLSILVGLVIPLSTERGKKIIKFLQSGEKFFMHLFTLIMYAAPIGFFSYFAVTVSELGAKMITGYIRIALIYYAFAVLYFLCAFTFYAFLAGKIQGIKLFWKNILLPMMTSIATCSSAASIPANLVATKAMRVPAEICETAIPLGAMIHKDGSVIGGIIKIAFLFGIFHLQFSGLMILLSSLGVSLLVGTVMGAIPGGGMIGEMLILSVYGFPTSALMSIVVISIIIDPLATMLNVTGTSVSSLMIARLVHGKDWLLRVEPNNDYGQTHHVLPVTIEEHPSDLKPVAKHN